MRVRGESHLLLVGDAGTGKSALLRHAARLSPRSFDSIREHDRGAIHEAMEQQTLSAGLVCKLRTKCSVFAACNPKGKGYDHDRSISVNTGLPSPLLSRFDVVLLLLDKSRAGGGRSEEHDRDAQHILREACGEEGPPPEPDAATWPLEKMRAYVEFVRGSFRPSVTPPAQRAIVAYYSHQRQADTTSEARTTIRLLESAVRLAQAHARLMFREEVTLLDAIYVIVVLESSTLHSRLAGGSICALTSMFDETPDATYPLLRDKILDSLGIDAEGRPLRQEGGGGYPGERLGGYM
ncbi:hypothetical protein EMIHUDRAFT_233751 [Emiliania huxleyi CCMP1516]|uniref:MCM C-terminal AAA(+) ATPase domain-containing protein n=2 Tax=Emiliania huxleyi TaxID=2903 RepID=A0A0D3K1M4_EMIH1|nr:hypothetical protein EMIHUDRAFT_233751 [Emiliania huxleyi CCMP1516]EOD29659.1 hypothetical protein EMIHUDRAFT_233751 [Emiliania huxleyi CCMP1516]|eukprot:XP_005782088.1 hypothetical protein EMIHUDRAFT_233751 [Emiliania huxleyi CCMP1516]